MKCKECDTDMFVDHVTQNGDTEVFHYKCPNPQCKNFGYGKEKEEEKTKEEESTSIEK